MSPAAFLGSQNAPKLLAVGASPQTPLGSLQRSAVLLAGFKGPTLRQLLLKGKEGRGR